MRRTSLAFAIALGTWAMGDAALAQSDFPSRNIRLLVGFPPGGSSDILARTLAQESRRTLGQEIIILNRPGATGSTAMVEVATSPPDGYTIGVTPSTVMTLVHHFQSIRGDLLESTDGLVMVGRQRIGMVARKDSPNRTLKDLVAAAKKEPGKISISIPGAGTLVDLITRAVFQHEKAEVNIVPLVGDAQVINAVLGGHVAAGSLAAGGFTPQVREGTMILIASMEQDRADADRKVPTLIEMGYPYKGDAIQYLLGPKGLPPAVKKKLIDAFTETMKAPGFIDIASKNALYDKETTSAAALDQRLLKERADLATMVDKLGLKRKQ